MQGFTWVYHPDTGNHWQCPDGVLDHMHALGWVLSEAPEEPNPAIAERVAWEQAQAAAKAEAVAAEKTSAEAAPAAEPKTPKPARRGENQES